MIGLLKPRRKTIVLLSGMAKAFDMGNRRRVFGRAPLASDVVLYSNEKTDEERLSEDWEAIGRDMYAAIDIVGDKYGK